MVDHRGVCGVFQLIRFVVQIFVVVGNGLADRIVDRVDFFVIVFVVQIQRCEHRVNRGFQLKLLRRSCAVDKVVAQQRAGGCGGGIEQIGLVIHKRVAFVGNARVRKRQTQYAVLEIIAFRAAGNNHDRLAVFQRVAQIAGRAGCIAIGRRAFAIAYGGCDPRVACAFLNE